MQYHIRQMFRQSHMHGLLRFFSSGVLFVLFFCVLHITPSVVYAAGDSTPSSHTESGTHSARCIDHSVIRSHNDDAVHTALLPATMPAPIAYSIPAFVYEGNDIPPFSIIGLLPERLIFIRDNNIRI